MKKRIETIVNTVMNPKGFARSIIKDASLYRDLGIFMEHHGISNINEAVFCVVHDSIPPLCPCGKKALFNSYTKGYRKFCSANCPHKGITHSSRMNEYWQENGDLKKASMVNAVKTTMIERYGKDNAMHVPEIVDSIKKTNIERYGTEFPLQSKCIQEKIKSTIFASHGVEYPFQSAEIRAKGEETFFKNHGHKNDMRIPRQSFIDQYGANPFQLEWVKDTIKTTMTARHGKDHPMKVDSIYEKSIATLKSNHGKLNPAQLHLSSECYTLLNDAEILARRLKKNTLRELSDEYSVSMELIRTYHDRHGLDILPKKKSRSSYEEEIAEFLDLHNISYKRNFHGICHPRQVDFYIKDFNIAIEFNGLYWHSQFAGKKDKKYHSSKQDLCARQGIQLLTIFEDEWIDRHQVIKNKILHLCGKTRKIIGARKIQIEIATDMTEIKEFLLSNHLQGKTEAISLALVGKLDDEIVSVMTLRRHLEGHDMTRYCVKNDASYPGLFSKFISHIRKHNLCSSIVTFADLRWSIGDVYEKAGFSMVATIAPDYFYTDYKKRDHKFNYRKDKLKTRYGIEIDDKTELEIIKELGLDRIWDCGKIKYKLDF